MPFGAIYAALFLVCFAAWLLMAAVDVGAGSWWLPRASLALAVSAVACSLLARRRWARWAGVGFALAIGWLMFRLAGRVEGFAPLTFLLGAFVALVLLLWPTTGASVGDRPVRSSVLGRWLVLATALGVFGVALSLALVERSASGSSIRHGSRAADARPAGRAPERLRWSDFGQGTARAAREGRTVLAVFVTSWCGYCKKMDRTTWRDGEVIDRLAGLVTVRVDTEESRPRNGYTGVELARRYRIQGTPDLLLLDAQGRVLSRSAGYHEPARLLRWLDGVLGPARDPSRSDNLSVSSP